MEDDDDGNLKNPGQLIQCMGFEVGCQVVRQKTGERATLTSLGSRVGLSMDQGEGSTFYEIGIDSFLKGEWKVTKKQAEMVKFTFDELKDQLPGDHALINLHVTKGEVMRRLMEQCQHKDHLKVLQGLTIQTKPFKSVFAAKGFAKEKLILYPISWRLDLKSSPGSISLGTIREIQLYIQPCVVMPSKNVTEHFLPAFWMVKRCSKPEDANMVLKRELKPEDDNNSVKTPYLVNPEAVQLGEELKYYQPKEKVEPEALVPVGGPNMPPPNKRARTKGPGGNP